MSTVVRARIDEKVKEEAAAEKRLPFDPLAPSDETIEAMKAARRGELAVVVGVDGLMADLNADD